MTIGLRPWTGDAATYRETSARRVGELEPRVRALTHVDGSLEQIGTPPPSGPLVGMPVAVKEIIDVAGMPTTYGSPLFAGRVPDRDAEAVALLRAAGAVVVAMTSTTPFACGTTTITDNPRAPGHTPGGSSAGSGAAVGAGFVPLALASQSQASTLRPASYCGAWGFKPSHGRLPTTGMHVLAEVLDDLGLIAASIADLQRAFAVLARPRPSWPDESVTGPRLRIGRVDLDDGGLPSRATRQALDGLVGGLAKTFDIEAGTERLRAIDQHLAGSGTTCFDLFAGQSAPTLDRYVAAGEPDPRLREMVAHAAAIGAAGLRSAALRRKELRARWASLADRYDVLVTLATTSQAPLGHASTGCRRMPATSSLLGVPAISAPWLTVDGLPQGVQLLGFEGRDEELLAAAAAIDAAMHTTQEDPR